MQNTTQAYVGSGTSGNIFNLAAPTGGNYWSNWTSPDKNSDGFVDSPCTFTNGRDNLPWTKINGWVDAFQTTDNASGNWQKEDFSIILTCKDSTNNNCDQTFYRLNKGEWQTGNTVNINTEGFHLVEYYSVHQGITEQIKTTFALLDKTPPEMTGSVRRSPVWENWYNSDVPVVFKALDKLSGVDIFENQVVVTSEGANQSTTNTATDKAGNIGSYTVSGVNIDKTPPVTTIDFSGQKGVDNWYKSDVLVSLSVTDAASGVARTEYSFDAVTWQTYTGPFSITDEGLNRFYYRSIDNVGNVEAISRSTTTLYSDGFKNNYNPVNWPDATFLPWYVGRSTTLGNSTLGVNGKWYDGLNMRTDASPSLNSRRWGIGSSQSFTAGPDMRFDYMFLPHDASNKSGLTELYLYDQNKNKYIKFAANYLDFYNRPVEVEISGLETRSSGNLHKQYESLLFRIESRLGKTKFLVIDENENIRWSTVYNFQINDILDQFKVVFAQSSTTSPYNFYAQVLIDDLQLTRNDYTFSLAEVNIDKTAPVINADFSGTIGANDWYIDDVTATLTATDNNGIDKIEFSYDGVNWQTYLASVVLTSSGEIVFYYRAFDLAGNVASGSKTIKIDKTPPVTSVSLEGDLGNNGWYRSDVIVTLTAVDNEGGMDQGKTEYSFDQVNWLDYLEPIIISGEGKNLFYYRSTDSAGNQETIKTERIKIDKTTPEIAGFRTPEANKHNWNNTDVMVNFSCSDSISGIESCLGDTIITTEGTDQTITGTAVDKAGNTAVFTITDINIDKTTPVITIFSPEVADYLLNQQVLANWSAEDPLSGISNTQATVLNGEPIDTSSVGPYLFKVEATDYAGNTSRETVNYYVVYQFSGVLPPINAAGKSIFKLKSTIPVKFKLYDVNNNLIDNAIAYLNIAKISNDVVGEEEEAVSTSKATEGNLFRYDLADQQYIFNLDTKYMSTGTWVLKIYLDDGKVHEALILLR